MSEPYVFSPLYEVIEGPIPSQEGVSIDAIHKVNQGELFLLHYISKGDVYLINPTIKDFIDHFVQPISFEKLVADYSKKVKSSEEVLRPVVKKFFSDMKDEGIIIPESQFNRMPEQEIVKENLWAKYKINDRIDDYVVLKELALRKNAQLYVVLKDEQQFVLKIFTPQTHISKSKLSKSKGKFLHEYEIMGNIPFHPNVCQLIEAKTDTEFPYGITELIEGKSLRHFIKHTKLHSSEAYNLIDQMVEAMSHLHNNGIIHGDIHLSNFLITKSQEVKLFDFDLSNRIEKKEGELERSGAVYTCVPPERINRNAFDFLKCGADVKSDIFQLGIMIYYTLYQEMPFKGFTWEELANEISTKEIECAYKSVHEFSIDPIFIQIIKKATQKDPTNRFNNISEIRDILQDRRQ